jgi:NhaA family Na+:H+ antiporter
LKPSTTNNRLSLESISGILLILAAMLAMLLKNAGVLNAFFIPLARNQKNAAIKSTEENCLLSKILDNIHPYVALGVLPLFAFVNAGIDISSTNMANYMTDIPLGIFLGLVLGKQIGVFGFSFLAIKLKLCQLPEHASWRQLYGTSVLCGIGFTMSLFIASLAFEHGGAGEARIDRLAIILASVVSAIWGVIVLKRASSRLNTAP